METTSVYPVICTHKLNESKSFYTSHFDFLITFDSDWYVSLQSQTSPAHEFALLDATHPTLPQNYQQSAQGLLLNIEVTDVDREYQRLVSAGLPMILKVKSEEWGQRHFITTDPNGVLIDVIQPIEPSESFKQQYQ